MTAYSVRRRLFTASQVGGSVYQSRDAFGSLEAVSERVDLLGMTLYSVHWGYRNLKMKAEGIRSNGLFVDLYEAAI